MEIAIKDLLYILVLVIGVASSHFMNRARIMVLEERSRTHGDQFDKILNALERLESRLEHKADR